ncbi:sigma-70 family RNA polymerase sigma factor [Virgibacillus halodenitrificans]|uniref:sigma-70 family RNA polymerase sigma factor n=1 Tax=Virgibacillus halodenitrificans TaxID=1482 RepID=UPI001EEF0210|nr:sigma-70 family RNA polymerase sigma factor [Virgibacillus halodenitrificans]MCG1027019.1 sigma-70 family RNA polymerase sigma factor [Virgibacillus halodenitrificans]
MRDKMTFEEIMKQNERRIHYHIHKLNIRDPHKEYFNEGLIVLWRAYESYQPDKGPLATYFNYSIRNRLIDKWRKQRRQEENERVSMQEQRKVLNEKIYYSNKTDSMILVAENASDYDCVLEGTAPFLTENQKKWMEYYIKDGWTLKEIADHEGVTYEAVKSWGRQVRKKLRAMKLDSDC